MSLVLTEEQEEIRRTARDFVRERAPVTHLRDLRDRRDPIGISRELWRELARLGIVGMAVPEAFGGTGLGFAELGLVAEELGRNLVPTPLLSTVVLAGGVIQLGGSDAQKRELLPGMCSGERLLALAHEEGTRHEPWNVATRAERTRGGYVLDGEKSVVLDGHIADTLVVVARTDGMDDERDGLTLFLVPRDTAGVSVRRMDVIDSRNVARVRFEAVSAPEATLLGRLDHGAEVLEPVLDRGAAVLAAEMFGGMCEAFERTLAYLKVRKQFGVPIGSFQALKHRAAHMFCEVELARSIVLAALRALDADSDDAPLLVSAAKARTSDAFVHIAAEAVQMHGGIGVTDELDVGLFYKRAKVAAMTLGNAAYHRDRFARLRGY